ncbi:MAG: ABC transporter substrate-binding protein [Betaproteobacteria bacterium]|nr:MAG: ABC transporter substrate-binding protein [Betaproteobacteria bacterium]
MRIAINPWPGYEFLYLADQKGFFKAEGLDVELLELASLADVKRVFEQGRADAMASTAIEVVQVATTSERDIAIVLVPDYSNGGDVIVARDPISILSELKGKKVGVEIGLLGTYILSRAMQSAGLSADDVIQINVEQLSAEEALMSGEVDAMVTYPPFSTSILKHKGMSKIFSTAQIPEEVIDTVSIRADAIANPTIWQEKFHNAWQRALDFADENPEEAYRIMAAREGITPAEFADALTGMKLLSKQDQSAILGSGKLKANLEQVCETLNRAGDTKFDCMHIHSKAHASL